MKKLTLLVVMAMLCPFLSKEKGAKSKDDSTNNKQGATKYMVTLLLIIFNGFAALSQEPQTISPLKVGGMVPKYFWNIPMQFYKDGKYVTETLKQYEGKVIIFDSWASWCGNCIAGFPKMKKLQDNLGDGLQIILVNGKGANDSNKIIEHVFEVNKLHLGNLPTIVQDTLINKLFPSITLPNYVTITSDGYLTSITESFMFNPDGIKELVAYRAHLLKIRAKFNTKKGGE